MLYRLRSMFAVDIYDAWAIFGGIVDQMGHLSIIPNLATTASVAAALLYDILLSAHVEEIARARRTRVRCSGFR